MVVSWLGINRSYINNKHESIRMPQIPLSKMIRILQTITDDVLFFDSGSDRNTDIECKTNSPILGRR